MSNTDRDSMLERWAEGMEKLEQYYEDLYGPPAAPAMLPAVTDRGGMLEAIADGLERAKRNINKKSPTYHNTSEAYIKTVPAGDIHYASLEQIGGKTLVMNQLAQYIAADTAAPYNASLCSASFDDGVMTCTVIDTSVSANYQYGVRFNRTESVRRIAGHKYYVALDIMPSSNFTFTIGFNDETVTNSVSALPNTWTTSKTIYTTTKSTSLPLLVFPNIVPALDTIFKYRNVMFVDLTLMFGAGHEPDTVAEFEAILPADYYAYNQGSLLSAGVTEVVSKDSNNATIQTISIPAEIRALEGYGWSCPSHYNYIDFEAKKYVQKVGGRAYESDDESDSTVVTDMTTTYYTLTTPVETDISEYLTDDNLVNVEAGGTLIFYNNLGDDYRIPVPSTETFWVGEP